MKFGLRFINLKIRGENIKYNTKLFDSDTDNFPSNSNEEKSYC